MSGETGNDVTALLMAWRGGDEAALARLTPIVYDELHRLAGRYMRREQAGHTLQTTALLNEAYIRLVGSSRVRWQNRVHFYAVAAQLMRRVQLDPRKARVVELRFFGRLSLEETAEALNVSTDTVGRDWTAAMAWLTRELRR